MNLKFWNNPVGRFIILFLGTFIALYYFNILFIGITTKENLYSNFLDQHLNYIKGLRFILLSLSAQILKWMGYEVITSEFTLHALNTGGINVVYSCLGFGVMSFFSAFIIAWPGKSLKNKLLFIPLGLVIIQALNITRFILITLFWRKSVFRGSVDHHTLFNLILYSLLLVLIFYWINAKNKSSNP